MLSLFCDGTDVELEKELLENFDIKTVNDFNKIEENVVVIVNRTSILENIVKYLYNRKVYLIPIVDENILKNLRKNNNVIIFLAFRLKDLCLYNMLTLNKKIIHVEITLRGKTIDMTRELVQEMFFIQKLIGVEKFWETNLRISRNTFSIHANMYNKKENFTCSIFINKLKDSCGIDHNVTMYDINGVCYKIKNNNKTAFSYFERFGSSLSHLINSPFYKNYHDYKDIISKIKVVRGFTL